LFRKKLFFIKKWAKLPALMVHIIFLLISAGCIFKDVNILLKQSTNEIILLLPGMALGRGLTSVRGNRGENYDK
jgi:hypothetical protein